MGVCQKGSPKCHMTRKWVSVLKGLDPTQSGQDFRHTCLDQGNYQGPQVFV